EESPSPGEGENEMPSPSPGEGESEMPSPSPGEGEGEGEGEGAEPSATPAESPENKFAGEVKSAGEPNQQKPPDKNAQIAEAELTIKMTRPGDANPPEETSIDGLEIHATGQSRQFEIHNFSTSSSVTYNYTILSLKAGRFTIPPQTVRAGGSLLRTPALTLNVADSPGHLSNARPSRGTQSQSVRASDLVFAELIVPKKTAYVGEIVPVQIRMGFDPRVRPR